ncbi:MAG: nucleotidyltransferase family protein [Bacillus sp. (in: firmicutes)]
MGVEAGLDMSGFSTELKLLLSLLQFNSTDNDIRQIEKQYAGSDWDKFLQLAIHHRVYPFVYRKLSKIENDWIPSHILQTLRVNYQQNTFQMLQLSAEMEYVMKQFSESNIRSLVLKGPILAADLYGDISLRTSKDLDILIPYDKIEEADEILSREGYMKEEYPIILKEWKWKTHHFSYLHSTKKINIELHWRLHNPPDKEPSFQSLWERKRVSKLSNYPINHLGNEDLYLYLMAHGARHGWFRLRWLLDIDQLSRKEFNRSLLKQLIKRSNNHYLIGQGMMLSSQLLHTSIPKNKNFVSSNKKIKDLAQYSILFIRNSEKYHASPEAIEKDLKRYSFSLQTSFIKKIKYVLVRLYPTHEDAEMVPLPKRLHFLYFPLRPFLWAWREKTGEE